MKKEIVLTSEFVMAVPENLEEKTLYISMDYATVAHKCCCGCGCEVVTPLSPTDWKLTYDGQGVTLYPSIGNWSFPCRSHYWIDGSTVRWAEQWSQERVAAGRTFDRFLKTGHYAPTGTGGAERIPSSTQKHGGFWARLIKFWSE